MKKRNLILLFLAVAMVFSLFGCGGGKGGGDKDTIVFGGSRSITGVYAFFEQSAYGPIYKMWVDDANAAGGLYVKEYDKNMKIELKVYDDTSDLSTMTRNLEKAIVEDQVDFILPPVSTAFLYAAAPIANKYGKVLIGAEGGSATLKESIAQYPYFFSSLNFSDTQAPALVEILQDQGIQSAYVVFIEDLHGTEYPGADPGAGQCRHCGERRQERSRGYPGHDQHRSGRPGLRRRRFPLPDLSGPGLSGAESVHRFEV
jgi:hypothetical protein